MIKLDMEIAGFMASRREVFCAWQDRISFVLAAG
jgi:hypothetical protein